MKIISKKPSPEIIRCVCKIYEKEIIIETSCNSKYSLCSVFPSHPPPSMYDWKNIMTSRDVLLDLVKY